VPRLSPIERDDMCLPHSSPPPFFQCVLISNVCGSADDGFMKNEKNVQKKKKKKGKKTEKKKKGEKKKLYGEDCVLF